MRYNPKAKLDPSQIHTQRPVLVENKMENEAELRRFQAIKKKYDQQLGKDWKPKKPRKPHG